MEPSRGTGKTIRALRKMKGMTQAELAEKVGLQRSSITNIELGNQMLTENTINAIAEALGYTVHLIFRRK